MVMASTASLPTPSHMNMDSMMAVPPNRLPMDSASSVTMVSIEDLMTLRHNTTLLRTPRACAPMT